MVVDLPFYFAFLVLFFVVFYFERGSLCVGMAVLETSLWSTLASADRYIPGFAIMVIYVFIICVLRVLGLNACTTMPGC